VLSTSLEARQAGSHLLFSCNVESRLTPQPGVINVRRGRLLVADIAGDPGAMLPAGDSGLAALSLVITQLSEQQTDVPYRASKLTRLLQESLGGNAKTVFIAGVSSQGASQASCLQGTLATLALAGRARRLANRVCVCMCVVCVCVVCMCARMPVKERGGDRQVGCIQDKGGAQQLLPGPAAHG
jgi:kinesin family member 15